MYEKENIKFTVEYEENSFYQSLTPEEQERYLNHIISVKWKFYIHQFDHLLRTPNPEGRPLKDKFKSKKRGRPFV